MNRHFSARRLRLLLRSDIVTGYRALFVASGALAGVILVAAYATGGDPGAGRVFYRECFAVALFVWGIVASSRSFRTLHDKTRNEAYLLVPASALEKTLARLLAVTVGLAGYLLVFVCLVSVVVESLGLVLFGHRFGVFDPFDPAVRDRIFAYMIFQPFYFLGGAWFRRAQFVKSTLAITLTVIALAGLTAAALRLVFADYRLDIGDVFFLLEQADGASASAVKSILFGVALAVPLACWAIAWLRVRETQVSDGV